MQKLSTWGHHAMSVQWFGISEICNMNMKRLETNNCNGGDRVQLLQCLQFLSVDNQSTVQTSKSYNLSGKNYHIARRRCFV